MGSTKEEHWTPLLRDVQHAIDQRQRGLVQQYLEQLRNENKYHDYALYWVQWAILDLMSDMPAEAEKDLATARHQSDWNGNYVLVYQKEYLLYSIREELPHEKIEEAIRRLEPRCSNDNDAAWLSSTKAQWLLTQSRKGIESRSYRYKLRDQARELFADADSLFTTEANPLDRQANTYYWLKCLSYDTSMKDDELRKHLIEQVLEHEEKSLRWIWVALQHPYAALSWRQS